MSSASTSTPASKSKSTPAKIAARRKLKADQNGTLLAGAIMAGVGWVLLVRLVGRSPPLAFPRWLFFILIYFAITGTVLPLIWYLNRRFSRRTRPRGASSCARACGSACSQ